MPDALEFQSGGESGPPLSAFGDRMVAEKEHMFFRPQTGSVPHGPSPPRPAPITRRGWVMNHSTWDLEVYAREMQQRRFREADRARQIQAARQSGDAIRIPVTRFSISRLIAMFRQRFSTQPVPVDGARSPALAAAQLRPLSAEEPRVMPGARPSELSQPYAGMMILARGTGVPTTAQPWPRSGCAGSWPVGSASSTRTPTWPLTASRWCR